MSLIQELSKLGEREVKFGEAAIFNRSADVLSNAVEAIDKLITEAPTLATEILAAVEKADVSVLGAEAPAINLFLSSAQADIAAEIEIILNEVEGYTQKVVTALRNLAAKLQAEALAA